jgi:4-diphosphocytidyl-2-C-methyl-D-erythritol kinase
MLSLSLDAPCKINLHLRVKERRPDGFHELESVFLALAFGDTLNVELGEAGRADEFLIEPGPEWPPGDDLGAMNGPDNTVLRAAALFRAKTGFDRSLSVVLKMNVPAGAGLGGGSSDGAAALIALNRLAEQAGHPRLLDQAELWQAAAELGSDVPFFLGVLAGTGGNAAFVSGRGERLRPIAGPGDCAVLLVNPGFPSNTAEAYRLLDRRRDEGALGTVPRTEPSERSLIEALGGAPSRWPYRNDFLELFLGEQDPRAAAYRTILERLRSGGADFCGLTGSGSTCFGIFVEGGSAEQAAETVRSIRFSPECGLQSSGGRKFLIVVTFPLAFLGKRVL